MKKLLSIWALFALCTAGLAAQDAPQQIERAAKSQVIQKAAKAVKPSARGRAAVGPWEEYSLCEQAKVDVLLDFDPVKNEYETCRGLFLTESGWMVLSSRCAQALKNTTRKAVYVDLDMPVKINRKPLRYRLPAPLGAFKTEEKSGLTLYKLNPSVDVSYYDFYGRKLNRYALVREILHANVHLQPLFCTEGNAVWIADDFESYFGVRSTQDFKDLLRKHLSAADYAMLTGC